MQELVRRLRALDPDASAGVQIIAYFDALVAGAASVEAFLRGAAVLTGCAAGIADPERRIRMRLDPKGRREDGEASRDPAWPSRAVSPGGPALVWIERAGAPHPNDDLVLERLALGASLAVQRTRGASGASGASGAEDEAVAVALLLDRDAAPDLRLAAAARLSLPSGAHARVVASVIARADASMARRPRRSAVIETPIGPVRASVELEASRVLPRRAGVGTLAPILDLPASWSAALLALRFTAAGTAADPGPSIVHAEELGALAALADGDAHPLVQEELRRLDDLSAVDPSALAALDALSRSDSLRAAATAIHVHHSTMQARCQRLEDALGYSLRTPAGRARLHVALALRRLRRSPLDDGTDAWTSPARGPMFPA